MNNSFESDAYHKGREILVFLRGRLIAPQCQEVKNRLGALFSPEVEIFYLDLADLEFLDSAGLGVLVGLKMIATKHCLRLILLAPQSRVEDILRISKLDVLFEQKGAIETELVRRALQREEYCVWRDSRDCTQNQYLTEAGISSASITNAPGYTAGYAATNNTKIDHWCADAMEYLRQGDYERAAEAYRQVLNVDENHLSAMNNLAIIYEKRPEWYQQAIEIWQRIIRLSEQRADERHGTRARKHLESLIKLLPPVG